MRLIQFLNTMRFNLFRFLLPRIVFYASQWWYYQDSPPELSDDQVRVFQLLLVAIRIFVVSNSMLHNFIC